MLPKLERNHMWKRGSIIGARGDGGTDVVCMWGRDSCKVYV